MSSLQKCKSAKPAEINKKHGKEWNDMRQQNLRHSQREKFC